MLIKDIHTIKSNKTVMGATCPNCGGDLIISPAKASTGKIIQLLSFGIINIHFYRCDNCKRKFKLI